MTKAGESDRSEVQDKCEKVLLVHLHDGDLTLAPFTLAVAR